MEQKPLSDITTSISYIFPSTDISTLFPSLESSSTSHVLLSILAFIHCLTYSIFACLTFIAKYIDWHYLVTRYRFIGYLINNSLRSNSLSDHAYCIERVPHEIVICLIFSYKLYEIQLPIFLKRPFVCQKRANGLWAGCR